MIHQETNHSWNGSVMNLFVFVCLCVSVCDVRLYVCSGGVISLSISLFSFHCVSASDQHMCEKQATTHVRVKLHCVWINSEHTNFRMAFWE